jgi:hypothetical protein
MQQHTATTAIGLVGPFGTEHSFVELWRESPRDHFTLIGHFATVFDALFLCGTEEASWYLTSADGRQYARLETGCN